MDRQVRAEERSEGWLARAQALRRSGEPLAALRLVQAAVRAGSGEAGALLEEWAPLSGEAAALRTELSAESQVWEVGAGAWRGLLLACDPRCDAWLEAAGPPRGVEATPLPATLTERACAVWGSFGSAPPHLFAATPDEVEAFGRAASRPEASPRERFAAALLASAAGERALAEELCAAAGSPWEAARLRFACRAAAEPLGRAGLGLRPAWVAPLHREALGLGLDRDALRRPGEPWGHYRLPPGTEAVALVDLDELRLHNDVAGLLPGDERVQVVSAALQDACGDRVVRWGGDEWLVPWEARDGLVEALEAAQVALATRSDLATTWEGREVRLGFSAGVARVGPEAEVVTTLRRADEALYAAKQGGRGRVVQAEG